jgi:hypothetical protein
MTDYDKYRHGKSPEDRFEMAETSEDGIGSTRRMSIAVVV